MEGSALPAFGMKSLAWPGIQSVCNKLRMFPQGKEKLENHKPQGPPRARTCGTLMALAESFARV